MNRKPKTPAPMERPSALYQIHTMQVSACMEALLYSRGEDLEALAEYLSLNRVILGDGGFCLLLGKICFAPGCGQETLMDANGLFAELLEEQLVRKSIYYMLPVRGLVLCLTAMPNLHQESRRGIAVNEKLWQNGEAAAARFMEQTGLDLLCAVSPICYGLDALPGTFQRTLDLLEFHSFFGQRAGLCGNSLIHPKRSIRLSHEFQERCMAAINLLAAGQWDDFLQNVTQDLEHIRTLVPDSLQQYRTLCFQFLDRLCYDLIDHHLADAKFLERTDLFWLVHEPADFQELSSRVSRLLDQMLSGENLRNRRHGRNIDAIKAYMQVHCSDCNLTVSGIAAEFGMTQPVFSAFFRKHSGTSPLEYLNKQRVGTAMKLLQTTDAPLAEIAALAGFGSIPTLHRVFRKYTGITPGNARQTALRPAAKISARTEPGGI